MSVRTKLVALVICSMIGWILAGTSWGEETRTWSDATGAFTVEAEMVGSTDGVVYLKLADGKVVNVPLDRLSADDQAYAESAGGGSKAKTAKAGDLAGKPVELKNDDGTAAGKKSLPMGIASAFQASEEGCYLTEMRIHGNRYGQLAPPKEDFHVTLCDKDFNPIADFPFPYSKFAHASKGDPKWVTLKLKATEVPKAFVICLDFKAERTKGVYVSHDKEGKALVGLPKKPAGAFTGGDWMVRVSVDRLKADQPSSEPAGEESKP